MKKKNQKQLISLLSLLIIAIIYIVYNNYINDTEYNIIEHTNANEIEKTIITKYNIPEYSGNSVIELNGNIPEFKESDFKKEAFETYTKLDELGRCGIAYANICKETMPTEARGDISYKPTGWIQNKYTSIGGYLYNRCHLIAWMLSAENNNKENLLTGTTQLNRTMINYESAVAKYIKENGDNHVLYRVTPIFEGNNLLASGVQIEAMSVEEREKATDVCFNVYIYNVQPGIYIDYATGNNYEKLLLD